MPTLISPGNCQVFNAILIYISHISQFCIIPFTTNISIECSLNNKIRSIMEIRSSPKEIQLTIALAVIEYSGWVPGLGLDNQVLVAVSIEIHTDHGIAKFTTANSPCMLIK